MALERTLSIIKPDAVAKGLTGEILCCFEQHGLRIAALKMCRLSESEAREFYAEHAERGFFGQLIEFMTSGPVTVQVLCGENAITANRELMGHTNPSLAAPDTLRAKYAASINANAVHGSDSPAAAQREIAFFFPDQGALH